MDLDKELLNAVFKISEDAIIVCDHDNKIIRANTSFNDLAGYSESEVLGRHLFKKDERNRERSFIEILSTRDEEALSWSGRVMIRRKNGEAKLSEAVSYTILDEHRTPQKRLTIIRIIPDRMAEVTGTEINPQYDPLTGLPNANLLNDRLNQATIAANREQKSVAVLLIGLDRFNMVNDGLGFEMGDLVLKEIGARFAGTIRKSDTIARFEGDRFCLVMIVASSDDSVIVAEKILKAMQTPVEVAGSEIYLTASIGISIFPADSDSGFNLLKHSESAMRHIKKSGGGGYQFYSGEMNVKAKQRIDLENSLRHAMEHNEFVLYYQPKVDIVTDKIVGAEALIRWKHPERGLVPPGDFIPVAEESGLIISIGEWVLRKACMQCLSWREKGLPSIRISINVVAPQFRSKRIVDQITETLEETGLPPHCLELEITESILMGEPLIIVETLNQLRKMGISISIDDFGTGYSSLSYLSRFPINTLKIDRAFIFDLQKNHQNAEITRAIIGLSRSLNLEVVAEGAELLEHIDFLREQGCDTVQGFFYSKPVSSDEFETLLRDGFQKV